MAVTVPSLTTIAGASLSGFWERFAAAAAEGKLNVSTWSPGRTDETSPGGSGGTVLSPIPRTARPLPGSTASTVGCNHGDFWNFTRSCDAPATIWYAVTAVVLSTTKVVPDDGPAGRSARTMPTLGIAFLATGFNPELEMSESPTAPPRTPARIS